MLGSQRVLIIGGTGEARLLAAELASRNVAAISSLAGRVQNPRLPVGEVRIGGFGGIDGLRSWLVDNDIRAVVDASHPFAARISANATAATRAAHVPLLRLARAPWMAHRQDRWTQVSTMAEAAQTVAARGNVRVLLTTGRQDVHAFAANTEAQFWIRVVDPPTAELPPRNTIIASRGPYRLVDERQLLEECSIDLLVTKNSGGEHTYGKILAARELGLEVVVVQRPADPDQVPAVTTVAGVMRWLDTHLGAASG